MGRAVKILPTSIPGLVVVETTPHVDIRGAFARLYCEHELANVMDGRHIVQVNHSRTATIGAIRGMHFQYAPGAETKLIRCLKGRVWDVAVDLRLGSPTFLQWHAEELAPETRRMLVVPEGCAHGFQVLEPDSELLYLHTAFYAPEAEGGVRYDDPRLGIAWPLPVTDVSPRDRAHPSIDTGFLGLRA
jgi:dTDP-4-dehydrorhamnose 3,5-epimerase